MKKYIAVLFFTASLAAGQSGGLNYNSTDQDSARKATQVPNAKVDNRLAKSMLASGNTLVTAGHVLATGGLVLNVAGILANSQAWPSWAAFPTPSAFPSSASAPGR